ncbi:MAG: D-alanyl-D-alanine carboxypeptidase family protein [Caulobacterales bacterium]
MTRPSQAVKLAATASAALLFSAVGASAFAQDRYAAIVIDARTNEVLHADQADEARYPASLTKMMTLYMLFEAIERDQITLDTPLVASRHAASQPPSRLGLRRGNSITVDQAIRALCVQSANDVAVLVAERLGGTEARFASRMTARARELGMSNTNFANASGLPNPNQRSTARDIAVLSQALWRDFPEYYHYFQTPSYTWCNHYGRNHNRLLGQVDGVDGIKTGYTNASGFNLASSAERDGHRVIAVVFGGESGAARDAQVAYLIEGAFEEYDRRGDRSGAATYVGLPTPSLNNQLGQGTVVNAAQSFGPSGAPLRGALAESGQGDASRDTPIPASGATVAPNGAE